MDGSQKAALGRNIRIAMLVDNIREFVAHTDGAKSGLGGHKTSRLKRVINLLDNFVGGRWGEGLRVNTVGKKRVQNQCFVLNHQTALDGPL